MKTPPPIKPDHTATVILAGMIDRQSKADADDLTVRNPPDIFERVQARMKENETKGGPSKRNDPPGKSNRALFTGLATRICGPGRWVRSKPHPFEDPPPKKKEPRMPPLNTKEESDAAAMKTRQAALAESLRDTVVLRAREIAGLAREILVRRNVGAVKAFTLAREYVSRREVEKDS